MKEETKKTKPVKVPGVFKKPIKNKKYESRFVKYVEHPQDKKFFTGCFQKHDEESVLIRDNLTKDDVKKLKGLIKVIKANRKGAVKVVPLLFASAIVAAIVIFFVAFANPLLGRALEKGLEAIFEAKADVRGFRLSLLKFEISIQGITVANRDKPMTNLFQMSKTGIKLKPAAVLRGKIYIEEIRADEIRFGTARTTSGALTDRPEKVKKQPSDAPAIIDLKNFDAMALLNQEYDKLNTPRLYDEAILAYDETALKWENQIESSRETITELRASSAALTSIDVNNMRDVETITKTIQEINTAVNNVQRAANEASTIVTGVENDITKVRQIEQNARNAITDDLNHLKSYIDLGSGSAFSALEPFIRDMLSDAGEQYFDYGLLALEALEKIKAMSAESSKTETPVKEKKTEFKGRDVHYPIVSYPAFYLGWLSSDFTLDAWNWKLNLQNISSNPDLTGATSMEFGMKETGGSLDRYVSFNGRADFRSNPQERFHANVNAGGFPVSLTDQLSGAGINGFSGETDFILTLTGQTNGAISGGGEVNITHAQLIDPKGTLAEAAATAVAQADLIHLGLSYIDNNFSITTNIADLIARALRQTAEVYAKQAMEEIERVLRQKIDEYIDGRFESKEMVDALLAIAKGDKAAIDQVNSALASKRTELENKANAAVNEAVNQATQQVTEQATQQLQNLIPGRR